MSKIVSVKEFVDLIGGNDAAASLFKVTAPAICNWKKSRRFPAWVLPDVARVAALHRVSFPAKAVKVKRPTGARVADAAE